MTTYRKLFLLSAIAFLAFRAPVDGQPPREYTVCDTCACSPDNRAPTTVDCKCSKSNFLILQREDGLSLANVSDLTLSGCHYVSIPGNEPQAFPAVARVTLRDMKMFHYTLGLFPVLDSLIADNVDHLVMNGFGAANRTLRNLKLSRTYVSRLVRGTLTAGMPLRRVHFDNVTVDTVESGALDMAFAAGRTADGGAATDEAGSSDGFTVVESTLKSVQTHGISVRSGAMRILNSTLDDLASKAITVPGVARLTGNRFDAMVGDSVSLANATADVDGSGGGGGDAAVHVTGNRFRTLPTDFQLSMSERPVEFRDNAVENLDLPPFLYGVRPAVNVTGNRLFACDCDPRRIRMLKPNQLVQGVGPDADDQLSQLLVDNYCTEPAANTTLAAYREQLIMGTACEGTYLATASSPPSSPPADSRSEDTKNGCDTLTAATAFVAVSFLLCLAPIFD